MGSALDTPEGKSEGEIAGELASLLDDDLHMRGPEGGDAPETRERDPKTGRFVSPRKEEDADGEGSAREGDDPDAAKRRAEGDADVEGDDAGEEEQPEKGEGEESEEEGEDAIRTTADLAAAFEVEEKELLEHIQVEGPDGKHVPLQEVIESYRKTPDAVRTSEQIQAKQRELDALAEKTQKEHDQRLLELQGLTERLVSKMEADAKKYSREELERLKSDDPQRYLIVMEELREQREAFQQAHRKLSEEAQKREQRIEQERESWMKEEAQRLFEKLPEWAQDQSVMQRESQQINQFLFSQGFEEQDLEALYDHRYVLIARKAMLYDQLQQKKDGVLEKRVFSKPKRTLRGEARRDVESDRARRSKARWDRFQKSGSVDDAAKLLEEII